MNYEITFNEDSSADDLQALQDSYQAFTEAQIGKDDRREIAFFIKDGQGSVLGGVKGSYGNLGWLWVDVLWVSEELRGKGYGAKLMTQIEEEAKKNGCTNVYLNSFSFQAAEFYKKIGYRVYGELKDFPVGHSVCSLTKTLIESNDVEQ
ncbi:MAG: GNAT family N-acetyltransferase [Pirellulales bacterium]|jgi:GNAT superfamily N-acetyltransferase